MQHIAERLSSSLVQGFHIKYCSTPGKIWLTDKKVIITYELTN
jgi:hypothetical protein